MGFQYYTGTLNAYDDSSQTEDDFKKSIISAMANVQYRKLFALGLEYDSYGFQQDTSGVMVDNKANAISLFGTLWFEELIKDNEMMKTLNFFFRYIMYDPDGEDLAGEMKSTDMIIGVECIPVDGFRSSLNYQSNVDKDLGPGVDDVTNSYLYLNAEFSF